MPLKRLVKAAVLVSICVPSGAFITSHLTISPSSSLGNHVFLMIKGEGEKLVKKGAIVRFPHNDEVTNGQTVFMLKRVECVGGEKLTVENKEYYCDGRYLGRAKDRSRAGKAVRNFVFNGNIPDGMFFAMAPHIDSYDSRYYGLVKASDVMATAYPISFF